MKSVALALALAAGADASSDPVIGTSALAPESLRLRARSSGFFPPTLPPTFSPHHSLKLFQRRPPLAPPSPRAARRQLPSGLECVAPQPHRFECVGAKRRSRVRIRSSAPLRALSTTRPLFHTNFATSSRAASARARAAFHDSVGSSVLTFAHPTRPAPSFAQQQEAGDPLGRL